MHNNHRRLLLVAGLLLYTQGSVAGAQAQTDPQKGRKAPPAAERENPEYSRRTLPADTFKPSEEISEDFAVPFPVDI
jgi:hypothetical protein